MPGSFLLNIWLLSMYWSLLDTGKQQNKITTTTKIWRVQHLDNNLCVISEASRSQLHRLCWAGLTGKLPLPVHMCTAHASLSLTGTAVKASDLPAGPCSQHGCIPRPGAFIPRSLPLRPWAEIPFRCLCWDLLSGRGEKGEILKIHSLLSLTTQYFPTPRLSSWSCLWPQGP